MIENIIAVAAILLIISGAVAYIVKQKKQGKGCIGCPDSNKCGGYCSSCKNCSLK